MFFWRKNTWAHRIGHSVFTHKKDYCTVFFGEKNHCDGEKRTLYTTEVFADDKAHAQALEHLLSRGAMPVQSDVAAAVNTQKIITTLVILLSLIHI